jgi:hypothetical protein
MKPPSSVAFGASGAFALSELNQPILYVCGMRMKQFKAQSGDSRLFSEASADRHRRQ